jgi:hypothetical protein
MIEGEAEAVSRFGELLRSYRNTSWDAERKKPPALARLGELRGLALILCAVSISAAMAVRQDRKRGDPA